LARAGAHGTVGGFSNVASGGNFWQGFTISSVSSLAGSGMQAAGLNGNYLPFATGAAGAGTAWAVGSDPMNGFFQGYSIGALNHKGEKYIATDGTEQEILIDDVVIMPRYYERNGLIYAWNPNGFDYLVGEKGLQTVYPEFDVLMAGRFLYTSMSRLFTSNAAKGGTNAVYQGLDAAGKTRYVGITSREPAVRFAEHAASGTAKAPLQYRVIKGAEGLSRIDARIWEQSLINQYGLRKNGGQLFNQINSIAPKYWWQYGIKP
jgi:hypothetical protein